MNTTNQAGVTEAKGIHTVSLRIAGDGLDFDELTRTLGLEPTRALRKGVILLELGQAALTDVWVYRLRDPGKTLDDHLIFLWEALGPHAAYLRQLKRRFQVSVYCHCSFRKIGSAPAIRMGGLKIGHQCLCLFTELEIPLQVGLSDFV